MGTGPQDPSNQLILPDYPWGTVINGKRVRRIYSELTVRQLLYNLVKREGSLGAVSKLIGVSKPFLSEVMRGKRMAGPKIAEFFDFERHVVYTRKSPGPPPGGELLQRNENGGVVFDPEVVRPEGEVVEVDGNDQATTN